MSRPVGRYDGIAGFYDGMVGDDCSDPATAALLLLVGDVTGQRVLDLACGQGRVSRALARNGARVVGVDVSAALLDRARELEVGAPLAIEYLHEDVTLAAALRGRRFDVVVCNHGLSDIDDLDAALATVRRVLDRDGRLVFAILHPCFPGWAGERNSSWPPAGYFAEQWWVTDRPGSSLRARVGANHRTLSTYVNELLDHDLELERLVEPLPPPEWVGAAAASGDPLVPVFLVASARPCRDGRAASRRRPATVRRR